MRGIFILMAFIASSSLPLFAQDARQQILFNSGWKFNKGDASSAEKINYDDGAWRKLDLPHDWSIEGPFSNQWASATAYLPGGIAWYRKSFTAAKEWKNKLVFVYFDGVYKNSEVWINGHFLGKRPNGFISFQYDLTPYLNFSGPNTIAVKVDHTKFADSRWYTGSGIYRNVYLKVLNPVHIDLWGVSFTTPQISDSRATANVDIRVNNTLSGTAQVSVKAELKDKTGKRVAIAEKKITVAGKNTATANLSFVVDQPQLWSVDRPDLYTLNTSVTSQGKVTDENKEEVGIRSIRFDSDKGFFLNGVNMKQKGVCLHDDAGVLGVAVPEEVWIRRLRILKEGGVNAIRMSHNPHADYLYRLCDEMGFLVQDEAFDEWEVGKNKWITGWNNGTPGNDGSHEYFNEWAEKDIRDMILRNRNRPSIIMWSIGNEIDYPNDPYTHEVLNEGRNPQIYGKGYTAGHPAAERMGVLSKRLVKTVKENDTTRPVTAALAGVVMSNTTTYPENLDVVGYNYQEYRYPDDHKKYPSRIIYGSENGMALSAWNAVDSNQYISGQYLWTGIDYMGEARIYPTRSSEAGLINLAGFTKPEYFFRQSLWADKPMIYIGTSPVSARGGGRPVNHRQMAPVWQGKAGDSVAVNSFTNCEEAELFLNGESLGREKMTTARQISWNVAYKPGELVVKGYNNGKVAATYMLESNAEPAIIVASVYKDDLIDPRTGIKQIEVSVTDANGKTVYNADNEITVTVSGGAKLLGIENGSSNDLNSYNTNKSKLKNGRLIIYVRPALKAESFQVNVMADGLKPGIVKF